MTLDHRKLRIMLQMQCDMNAKVNPRWLTAHYPFLRAVAMEGAEALEHAGWKWWKKQTRDEAQLRMELVDIWHFAMSDELADEETTPHDTAGFLLWDLKGTTPGMVEFDRNNYYLKDMDERSRFELLIGLATARRFDMGLFETLLIDAGMTWDTLYTAYIGKNVLNFFRQDNGYKEGTYLKVWAGLEDNEHLTDIMMATDQEAPDFADQVSQRLSVRYQALMLLGACT